MAKHYDDDLMLIHTMWLIRTSIEYFGGKNWNGKESKHDSFPKTAVINATTQSNAIHNTNEQ